MLELRDLTVEMGGIRLLDGFNLCVDDGEIVALLGKSGIGKSTLLRAICGLVPVITGSISVNEREVTRLPTHKRGIGLVFQENALLPHLNVRRNIAYGLRMSGHPRKEQLAKTQSMLQMLGIEQLAERSVDTLSGGEAKRVAVARTLATDPKVVLLDEPLTGLDEATYETVIDDILEMLRKTRASVIWVTHNEVEASRVANRVIRLGDQSPTGTKTE